MPRLSFATVRAVTQPSQSKGPTVKNPKRRETTTIATPAEIRSSAPVAVPAVDFVAAHPAVSDTCLRCGQPRDLNGRCSCSFEVSR
jgi:hypothetical protein